MEVLLILFVAMVVIIMFADLGRTLWQKWRKHRAPGSGPDKN